MSDKMDHPRMIAAVVDRDLGDAFIAIAKANERSTSAELRKLIKEHVEIFGADNGKDPVR